MKTLNIPRWLAVALALCLLWCVILALNIVPALRGAFGWVWPYGVPDWPRLLPAAISIIVYSVVALRLQRPWAIQCWSFLGAALIPVACLYVLGDPFYLLVTRTLSGGANGTHMAGTEITNLGETLRNWPQIMGSYIQPGAHLMESIHVALSPPALPIFYYLLNNLAAAVPSISNPLALSLRPLQCQYLPMMLTYSNAQLASAWFGVLIPLWAGLSVIPLYRAGGKLAAIWWPLVPSVALFTPDWNTFYPLLALIAYLWIDYALRNWDERRIRAIVFIVVAGVLTSLATFANVSIVPFVGLIDLYIFFFLVQRYLAQQVTLRKMLSDGILIGVIFSLGIVSIWLLYYAVSGVSPITLLSSILGQHLDLDRPYLPWIFLHLYDLAMFTGLPLAILAIVAIVAAVRYLMAQRPTINHRADDTKPAKAGSVMDGTSGEQPPEGGLMSFSPLASATGDPLALALGAILVIMALSGTARGETGRVWLFFSPFILILAARQLAKLPRITTFSVTAVQVVTLLTLVAFLRVVDTELIAPPTQPPTVQAAITSGLAAPVKFADTFSLIGQHGIASQDGIDLTLSWHSDQQASYPYYLSALVVGPDGKALPPSVVWQPFDNNYPITCWRPGQVITETRHLPLGTHLAPGDYWVSLSAFSRDSSGAPTGVSVVEPGTAPDTQVGVGPIHVP